MDPNPYSAPKASVADPVLVPVERPRVVLRAVQLLWVSFVLTSVSTFADVKLQSYDDAVSIAILAFTLVWFGTTAWLIFKLARGRSWARTAYLILALISYGLVAFLWNESLADYLAQPYQTTLDVLALLTELVALYLLFTKPANRWFAQPMRLP